jgi:hypothetical protein
VSKEGSGGAGSDEDDGGLTLPPGEFLLQLQTHERVLLELRERLYEGSWDRVLRDLRARLNGEPYIYKLSQTISRDIQAIKRLQAYEARHDVDLAALLADEEAEDA